MKILITTLIVLTGFVACIHARYTFDSGAQLSLGHFLTSNTKSDSKLKEGVVNWIKDQFDPELVKTWYELFINQRKCIHSGLTLAIEQTEEQHPIDVIEFIENYCPSAADAVDKLYRGLQKYVKRTMEMNENYLEDMPDSIRVPIEKISKQWFALLKNKEHQDVNWNQIYDALEEILAAPEADREALAKKNTFWAPFITGNVHSGALQIIQAYKKIICKEGCRIDTVELIKAIKTQLKEIKIELMDYFESRTRPEINLPEEIDRQFTSDIGDLYDIIDVAYAGILLVLDTLAELKIMIGIKIF